MSRSFLRKLLCVAVDLGVLLCWLRLCQSLFRAQWLQCRGAEGDALPHMMEAAVLS